MLVQLTPLQARVIGVLMEKETTTPDQYPLSLNALTLGCNQKSSRDPVLNLSESEVQNVLDELRDKHLLFEEHTGRTAKYKHRFCNTEFSDLKFTKQQTAIICVLLLRGPQTPGELRTRTNRLAEFANVTEVETALQQLSDLNGETLVVKLEREPGKRESRFAHMFSGDEEFDLESSTSQISPHNATDSDDLKAAFARIEALEKQVSQLQETIDALI